MMLYRNPDGTYLASSFDAEFSKIHSKESGERILRERVPEPFLSRILAETGEGFVLS